MKVPNGQQTQVNHVYQSVIQHCSLEPYHFVLNIGFNTGQAFSEVFKQLKGRNSFPYSNSVQGGTGRVIGTETSDSKIKKVKKEFHEEVNYGILELTKCTSDNMPFITDMFECVFTVNGLHDWIHLNETLQEIYRILRPGCVFVSSIQDYKEVMKNSKRTAKTKVHTVDEFIHSLKENGFVKIRTHDHRDSRTGSKYDVVKAFTPLVKDSNINS
ncbi:hypothetical protein ACF0H5_016520 [Mactra antiquata]